MAIDKYELIRKFMKSRIGAPIIEICEGEVCSVDEAVESASTKYWIALPYQTTDEVPMTISSAEVRRSISSIKDKAFGTNTLKDDAYFIGIGRYDDSGLHNIHPLGTNYFDQRLLGRDFGYHPDNRPMEDPRYLGDRVLLHASQEDLLFGEPDYRHDIVTDEIVFIMPPVEGTLHVWYNWGFCPTKTIELVPMVHFEIFKRMAALEFLEVVIAARGGITLSSADYQLDMTDITQKRDQLKEELDKELMDTVIIPGVWS